MKFSSTKVTQCAQSKNYVFSGQLICVKTVNICAFTQKGGI